MIQGSSFLCHYEL